MRHPAYASLLLLSGAAVFVTPCGMAATPPRMSEVQVMTPAEQSVLSEYDRQTAHLPAQTRPLSKTSVPAHIPEDFRPWWLRGQAAAIGDSGPRQRISLDELYARALEHSQQIRVFAGLPLIRETGIQEAAGAFDTTSYLQSQVRADERPGGQHADHWRRGPLSPGRVEDGGGTQEAAHHRDGGFPLAGSRAHRQQLDLLRARSADPREADALGHAAAAQGRGHRVQSLDHADRAARFRGGDARVHPAERISSAGNRAHLLGALRGARDLPAKAKADRRDRACGRRAEGPRRAWTRSRRSSSAHSRRSLRAAPIWCAPRRRSAMARTGSAR